MQCDTYTLPFDSWIRYYPLIPECLRVDDTEFQRLWDLHPAEFGTVNVFGEKKTPRWHQTYGKDYAFSGNTLEARSIDDPYLAKVLRWVNKHAKSRGTEAEYNGILVNWYADKTHSIGPHSDDERQLVPDSSIYSFSFGQERTFRVTSKKNIPEDEQIKPLALQMANNSLLIMGGKMQRYYKHEVPKGKAADDFGPRINITVRAFTD